MKNQSGTYPQLIEEISFLKQRIKELEQSETERVRVEEKLQTSEERFRLLFDNSPDGIFLSTSDGSIITANTSACRMFGRSEEELCQIGRAGVTDPTDPRLIAALEERKHTGKFKSEYYHIHKDGTRFLCEVTSNIFTNKDGDIRACTIFRDITERKKTEDALLEIRDKLLFIAEGSAIPQFVIDKNHTVILWNKALEIYSGIIAKDVLGTSNHWKAFYKEKRPCIVDLVIENVAENEISQWYGNMYSKSNLLDGAYETTGYFPHMKEGVWLHCTAAMIKDSSGNTMAGIETLEDITGLKAVEVSLRQAEQKFRSIFENAVEGIFQSTFEGGFISINPAVAHMHGFDSPEDMIKAISNIKTQLYVNPERRNEYKRLLKNNEIIENFESEMYRKDGNKIWTSMNVRAARDEAGNILYFEGTIENITQRKQTEQAFLAEKNFSESIIESMPGVFYCFDDQLKFIRWNKNFEHVSGYSAQELSKISPLDLFADEDRKLFEEMIKDVFAKGESSAETNFISKDNHKTPYFFTGLKVMIDNTAHLIGVGIDISSRKQAEEALRKSEEKYHTMSFTDELTGLYNRRGFIALSEQQLKIAERTEKNLLLFFADLDKMKHINDTLGHQEGDKALVEIATILKEVFRESDIIGRMGGDEFAVFAIDATYETREVLIKRLHKALYNYNQPEGRRYHLSLSIGTALYGPEMHCSLDELIAQADTLMYEEKRNKLSTPAKTDVISEKAD
jgi:diguanylate cyclase (GGDEF)-like protein/PAS domain S-box-containing protein